MFAFKNVFIGMRTANVYRERKYFKSALGSAGDTLKKVPKRENFLLTFFKLSEPIWVCDLGTGNKNRIFYQLTPDFDRICFFAAY